MARAVLSVSVDFDLALKLKELAQRLQTTESHVVGEALRSYFSHRNEGQESTLAKTKTEADDACCHV